MGYCSEAAVVRESCRRHAVVEFENENVNRFIYFVGPTLYSKSKADAETRFVFFYFVNTSFFLNFGKSFGFIYLSLFYLKLFNI